MSALTLYGLKTCDTCRKAQRALEAAGRDVAFVDIRDEADLPEKVPHWLNRIGPEDLVNRRSTTWRGLGEAEQARARSADGAEALLIAHPTLIKRPVIEDGAAVHAGWTEEARAALGVP